METVSARARRWLLPSALPSVRSVLLLAAVGACVVVPRLLWHRFLDPFEDGYQNWWIASTLVETGRYEDLYSGMTRGNWLPGYHAFAAILVAGFGGHVMPILKAANLAASLGTTAVVYALAKPRGRAVAVLAAILFALNPADIVIASFATPEALTLFAAFSGVLLVERRPFGARNSLLLGSLAFLAAAALRYEAWGFVAVYLVAATARNRLGWVDAVLLAAPAVAFAAAWWAWTSPNGFLPAIVIDQTSTDVRYKETIGALPPAGERVAGFLAWYFGWTPFAVPAVAWAAWRERGAPWTALLLASYAGLAAYTVLGFGHASARYVHLTVPIVCVFAASAVLHVRSAPIRSGPVARSRRLVVPAALVVALLLGVLIVTPNPAPGTLLRGMERAGTYLQGLDLPEGRILVTESPIAAYVSGYPASRMLGSYHLPSDPAQAEQFLVDRAAFVVMVTVPYYRLRTLFPSLADGADGHHLRLLFDATGPEYGLGAPRVLVFEVVP